MTYFPIDRDILTSSLWAMGTGEQVKVWLYLLLSADPRTGLVRDTDPAIALRCGLSVEATTQTLDWLASRDSSSRTRAFGGRRIKRVPGGGLLVLNYLSYQKKDYSTPRVQRFRERRAAGAETMKRVSETLETKNKNKNKNKNKRQQQHPPNPPSRGELCVELSDSTPGTDTPQGLVNWWAERTNTKLRSRGAKDSAVARAAIARAARLLKAGATPEDLRGAVEFALADDFYSAKGYAKQTAVVWKSAERVEQLAAKWEAMQGGEESERASGAYPTAEELRAMSAEAAAQFEAEHGPVAAARR